MKEVPDYFEPLVGWRAWGAANNEGFLKALAHNYYWVPGKALQNRCDHCGSPSKPTIENAQGFYAFKTVKQLLDDRAHIGTIIGQVYLWGTVIDCTRGYRAEFAYPKALICTNQWTAETLRKAWKIEVEVANIEHLYDDHRGQIMRKFEQLQREGRLP